MMKQLNIFKKDEGKLLFDVIQNMDLLKSQGIIDEWKLVENNTLISYSGKYKNVYYGGKIKISEYKDIQKHINNTIHSYSDRWGGGLWI